MGNSYTDAQRSPSEEWALQKRGDISSGLGIFQNLLGEKFMGREIDIPSRDYKQSLLSSISTDQPQMSQYVLRIFKCVFKLEATMCSSQEKCLLLSRCPDYTLEQLYAQRANKNQPFSFRETHQLIDRVALGLQARYVDSETFNPLDMSSIVYYKQKAFLSEIMMMGNDRECFSFTGRYPSPEIISTNPFTNALLDHLACNLYSVGILAITMNDPSCEVEHLYSIIDHSKQLKRVNKDRLEQAINKISDSSLKNKIRTLTQDIPSLRRDIYRLIKNQKAKEQKIKQDRTPLQQMCFASNTVALGQADTRNNLKKVTFIDPKQYRTAFRNPQPQLQNRLPVLKPQPIKNNKISIRIVNRKLDPNISSSIGHSIVITPSNLKPSTFSSKKHSNNKENINTINLITPKKINLQQQFSTIKQVTEYDDVSDRNRRSSFKSIHLQGRYDGSLVKGRREGFGKFIFPEGSYYEGHWKDDQMHGFGKLYYSNGALAYQGFWDNNQFHGKGKVYSIAPTQLLSTFDCSDFSLLQDQWVTYEGELVRDQKHGWGELTLSNGQKYAGQFKEDLVEGEGTFWTNDGVSLTGIWKGGKLIQIIEH